MPPRTGTSKSGWCITGHHEGVKCPPGSNPCPLGDKGCSCDCHKKDKK